MTPEQQIARLDKRLGSGVGARRERKRLKGMIADRKAQRNQKKTTEVTDAQ